MSIVNSTITRNILEPDGSRLIYEQHTGSDGKTYERTYRAAPGADVSANLADYAVTLLEILANAESEAVING